MTDVRLSELWAAVQARLATARIVALLYGTLADPPIYRETEDYSTPEGAEDAPWGRLVIIPATTLWPIVDAEGSSRKVQFLVRGEVNNFMAPGYEPAANLEALMVEVYDRLQGWVPTGFTYLTMAFKVYRQYTPQAMPMWDEGRGVWMMSAEFRCEAGAPALVP